MPIGKTLMLFGAMLLFLGLLISLKVQIPWFGKLPGDIAVKKENFSFYFPFTTCLVISVVLSLIFRFLKK